MITKILDACTGTANFVSSLEHAQAQLTLSYNRRGNLAIYLISPQGTRSTLLAPRLATETSTLIILTYNIALWCEQLHTFSLSLTDLTITPLRASMTGLSWPPTPGMKILVENGRWRSRMWLEPPTMVTSHPYILLFFFLFHLCSRCIELWCSYKRCQIQHILFGRPTCPDVTFPPMFSSLFSTIFY